jgi:hypothetical protein
MKRSAAPAIVAIAIILAGAASALPIVRLASGAAGGAISPDDINPASVLPQPSIEERDRDDTDQAADGEDCTIYETRVQAPPLIDWRCAEETAAMDGGDDLAKNFARALLAVRDHDYEERRSR